MIKFRCSHCKKKFGVPDDYAGRRIRCNTCDHHTFVPKSVPDTNQAAAADQPCGTAAPGCAANSNSPDDEFITAETLLNTPKSPDVEIQLQSFHHFTPTDSVIDEPAAKPATKNTVSELLKRCRPDPRTDRTELALTILSFISCIGPIIFIILIFVFLTAIVSGTDGPARTIADPNSTITDPNAVAAPNPFKFLPPAILARYAFFAFSLVISPLSLIASMYLVLRYSYDMPKTLYFSIVIHGLIFFSIFQG